MAILLNNVLQYRENTSSQWQKIVLAVESSFGTSITGIVKGEGLSGMTAAIIGSDYTAINDNLTTSANYTYSINKLQNISQTISNNLTPKIISITLNASNWAATADVNDIYEQNIVISGIKNNTKIDLQADLTTLQQMQNDNVIKLFIKNNNSTLTAYAYGGLPTVNLTVQATCTDVIQGLT